jgi:hypothetical protein
VKGALAQKIAGNRTVSDLKDQLLGEFRKWSQPENCSKLIRKAMEFEEKYKKGDGTVMPGGFNQIKRVKTTKMKPSLQ